MRVVAHYLAAGFLAAALCVFVPGCRSNQNVQAAHENADTHATNPNAVLNDADKNFVIEAVRGNIKERYIGLVVLAESQNKDIKDYAQMLVDDHTKALKELVDLMEKSGMQQPTGLPAVKQEAERMLSGLSGAALDRKFIEIMVEDHEKYLSEFRREANTAQASELKDYVTRMIPVLQEHLQEAQELQGKLGL